MPTGNAVCSALKEEAAPFRKIAGGLRRGHHISILLTGIGCRNAEKSVRELTKLTYSAKFEPL
jgi:purine-nucleoside phosphorylase